MVGGTPSQVWMLGGTPGLDGGGLPQVWMVGRGYPRSGFWGVPQVWILGGTKGTLWPGLDGGGVPQVWMVGRYLGYPPQQGLDGGGYPGYPPARSGWCWVPQVWMVGVPPWPGLDGGGYPGYPHIPPTIRQNSIVSTCYPAGGMPLAFTQEDFLVVCLFLCEMASKRRFKISVKSKDTKYCKDCNISLLYSLCVSETFRYKVTQTEHASL